MDYKRNEKYFGQSIPAWTTVVSFGLTALGLIFFIFIGFSRGGWYFIPIGLTMAVSGIVMMLVVSNVKIKDSEIDDAVAPYGDQFKSDFTSKFVKVDAARLRYEMTYGAKVKNPGDNVEPVIFSTFCFDESRALHKIGSDGKSRSSIFSFSGFALKSESICLGEREISLISPEQPRPDFFEENPYSELGGCELVNPDESGYSGKTQYRHLRITRKDGTPIIEFPILADAAADEYAADISQRISRAAQKISAESSQKE